MLAERVSRVIERTYAAAEGSEPWTAPLADLRQLLKGRMTSLLEYHGPHQPGVVRDAVGLDPTFRESYERYYWRCNVYLQRAAPLLRPGVVAPHEMYCSDREILRSEYYQDFQRHLGLLRVMAGAMTTRGGIVLLTVSRSPNDRAFSDEEAALVRLLLPHFQRALGLHERLSQTPTLTLTPTSTSTSTSTLNPAEPVTALTATEAIVASRLAAGCSVPEICRELRIRETTVRTHLRHLFQKTQTRRQAELVAWLLRSRARSQGP
jgi:DNA-binding CsgD family transcriptional regulator